MRMTLREALAIQAQQIEHYGPRYPGGADALRARMARGERALARGS